MNGFRIATIRRVPIRLHWTFVAFVGAILAADVAAEGVGALPWGLAQFGIIFSTVVLHELAHAVVAQRYGVRVRGITLLPIGGQAMLDRIPESPRQEAAITIAGPALNIVLAAATFAFIYYLPGVEFMVNPFAPFATGDVLANPTLFTRSTVLFFKVNEVLALFNLLPAFPMDGGRLLRAALVASGRSYVAATAQAVAVSRVCLAGFVLWGLVGGHVLLLVIAAFMYFAGRAEEVAVRSRHTLKHLVAGHLLPQEPVAVEPETELGDLVPWLVDGAPRHFPVVARGRVVGLLGHDDLVRGLGREGGAVTTAGAAMRPAVITDPAEPLADIARRLEERGAPAACIVERGRLAGLVSREMLGTLARQLDPAAD